MVYYSLFWGPGAISIIDAPRGAFTCRSSTLEVFVDFGPFRALLLSFGGPAVISTIDELRGAFTCQSSTHNFGRLWSISCTIIHHFGDPERFP